MFELALILGVGMFAGVAVSFLIRRERTLLAWLSDEMSSIREEVDQTRLEMRTIGPFGSSDMLDSVEGEDVEIAGNLDRMNVLLDRLNGLLRGGSCESHEHKRIVFREEQLPLGFGLAFSTPEELRKFGNLPPLSKDEIESIDWEYLFNRIRTDDLE